MNIYNLEIDTFDNLYNNHLKTFKYANEVFCLGYNDTECNEMALHFANNHIDYTKRCFSELGIENAVR